MIIAIKIILFFIVCSIANDYVNCIVNNDVDRTETASISSEPYIDGDLVINATVGKIATLKCNIHNLKNYKITWYHSGSLLALDKIRIKDDERYAVENSGTNEWKFLINPVGLSDEGHYSCRLSNGLKKFIYLRVGVPPTFTNTDSSHQVSININESSNLTLACEATGNPQPTIHWYKNSKHIADGTYLNLTNLTRHHHYEYECVARNSIPPDTSRHYKISVNFKPTINLMYHLQTFKPSDVVDDEVLNSNQMNLEFVCEIHGNPIKSLIWLKDGIKLKETKNLDKPSIITDAQNNKKSKVVTLRTAKLHQHKLLSRLQIKNVNENDNGLYECIVDGLDGEVTKSVSVTEIQPIIVTQVAEVVFKDKEQKSKIDELYNINDYNTNNVIEFKIDNKHTTVPNSVVESTERLIEKNSFSQDHKDIMLNGSYNERDQFAMILSMALFGSL